MHSAHLYVSHIRIAAFKSGSHCDVYSYSIKSLSLQFFSFMLVLLCVYLIFPYTECTHSILCHNAIE